MLALAVEEVLFLSSRLVLIDPEADEAFRNVGLLFAEPSDVLCDADAFCALTASVSSGIVFALSDTAAPEGAGEVGSIGAEDAGATGPTAPEPPPEDTAAALF